MGDIKKVLYCKDLGQREIEPKGIWVDLCENCHLHFKNYRFDFSVREWTLFSSTVEAMFKASAGVARNAEWREPGDPNDVYILGTKDPYAFSDYYPYRFLIEWQRDNTYHIHYRELRLRLSEKEFDAFADAFIEARARKIRHKEPNFQPGKQIVHIDDIQPYDEGHRCGELDEDYDRGIKYAKHLLKQGKKLRPILIRPDGQRLDGFKRYMAQKEMGFKEIEVIVDPKGKWGDQKEESLECEEIS